jgi:hypothetical protein
MNIARVCCVFLIFAMCLPAQSQLLNSAGKSSTGGTQSAVQTFKPMLPPSGIPNKISYQGLLTTAAGNPVQDGS